MGWFVLLGIAILAAGLCVRGGRRRWIVYLTLAQIVVLLVAAAMFNLERPDRWSWLDFLPASAQLSVYDAMRKASLLFGSIVVGAVIAALFFPANRAVLLKGVAAAVMTCAVLLFVTLVGTSFYYYKICNSVAGPDPMWCGVDGLSSWGLQSSVPFAAGVLAFWLAMIVQRPGALAADLSTHSRTWIVDIRPLVRSKGALAKKKQKP